ncbi:hypothetical protein J2S70_000902 [Trueperella bonasi]|uniref:SdrD B-like protein n=1 Tax=Trueperella bonasi TaxID=312286 RepID=A0ABT9NG28_9ACTO|nr:SdrD B-like domain-containing protein [Trueperella bonasi]MDP9806320.1 hypothetical protein [Trueperella bonasi]
MTSHSLVQALARPGSLLLALVLAFSAIFATPAPVRAAGFAPDDTATIELISDGTHAGPGTETFLRSEHGYSPADDDPHDGVISSGDEAIYLVELKIKAGPARKVTLRFSEAGTAGDNYALRLADFANLNMSTPIVRGTWDSDLNAWTFDVPRGAVTTITGTVAVRGEDTRANAIADNRLRLELTSSMAGSDDPIFTSVTEPVTVISAPMADLTISGGRFTQNSTSGYFTIEPRVITPEGYSSNGLTRETDWITDVDVSAFPAGTTWSMGGAEYTPENGVLKGLTANGRQRLTYVLPQEAMPSEDNPEVSYTVSLNVHPDSFSAGDLRNVPDPGNGQPQQYRTSTYKVGDTDFSVSDGRDFPNNNWARGSWTWEEPPAPGAIWRYEVFSPRNANQTPFEDGNIYWNSGSQWWEQSRSQPNYHRPVTWDSDLSHRMSVSVQDIDLATCPADASAITVVDEIDVHSNNASYQAHGYDTGRNVEVAVGGTLLDRSKYKVEWKIGERWYTTSRAPADAAAGRVTFAPDAFVVGDGGSTVEVFWPAKARDDYEASVDAGKLLNSRGSVTVRDCELGGERERNVPLIFPVEPRAYASISLDQGPDLVPNSGTFRTTWKLEDRILDPVVTIGNTARTVLTFDQAFDPSTFSFVESHGWQIESVSGNQVVLVHPNPTLSDPRSNGWSLGNVTFTVDTVPYLSDDAWKVTGVIREDLTVYYPGVASNPPGEAHASSASSAVFTTVNFTSSVIAAVDKVREVGDPHTWVLNVAAGKLKDGEKWSQEVRLPANDDIAWMREVNESNGRDYDIDPETGLDRNRGPEGRGGYPDIGRSKFHGDYSLATMKVEHVNEHTTVTFYDKDDQGNPINEVVRQVGPDGTVDLTGVENVGFFKIGSTGNISDQQSAGAQVTFSIQPRDSVEGDDYVAWLSPLDSPATAQTLMPWPDNTKVVMSEIAGTVWQDANDNTNLDDAEPRLGGVQVALEQLVDGQWVAVPDRAGYTYSTTTDGSGSYLFEGLFSGKYRVVLPGVERGQGREVSAINGDPEGASGDLVAGKRNRFNVLMPTEQTRSYQSLNRAAGSVAEVDLGIDQRLDNVNFGFVEPKVDGTLDKSPAAVVDHGDYVDVSWDVTITNSGNTPIKGIDLHDRTSKEVTDLNTKVSYLKKWSEFAGEPLDIVRVPGSTNVGVLTSEGYWISKTDPQLTESQSKRVEGMTGTHYSAHAVSHWYGSRTFVSTSDGLWLVTADQELRDTRATKIDGVTGQVVKILPLDNEQTAVLTDAGMWFVNGKNEASKVDITGTPIAMSGNLDLPGLTVITSDGVWDVSKNTEFKGQVEGEFLGMDEREGTFISTTEGLFRMRWNSQTNSFHKYTGYTGKPLAFAGAGPFLHADYGNYLVTTEGLWHFKDWKDDREAPTLYKKFLFSASRGAGAWQKEKDLLVFTGKKFEMFHDGKKVSLDEITGTPIDVGTTDDRKFNILTTDGFWHLTFVDSKPTIFKITGMTGTPIALADNQTAFDSKKTSRVTFPEVLTSDGVWVVNLGSKVASPTGQHYELIAGQSLTTANQPVTETGADGRDWVRRTYDLPTLQPGENMVITLTGTMPKDKVEQVVGNQAWVTSPLTPREGMEYIADPNLKMTVTGSGMAPGVPDIPVLPAPSDVDPAGIEGTDTVSLNPGGADAGQVDDLADQTPALIPASPSADLSGQIGGHVWYDTDDPLDNLRAGDDADPSDPTREERVAGMAVTIRDPQTGRVLAETVTDANGRWVADRLPIGIPVDVQYNVLGWEHDGKIWTPVIQGDAPGSANANIDSDADATGYINGTARQVVTVSQSGPGVNPDAFGRADLGLRVLDAGIQLQKGGADDFAPGASEVSPGTEIERHEVRSDRTLEATAPTLRADLNLDELGEPTGPHALLNDGDGDPRTNAYVFTVTNPANENLTNIALSDNTTAGNPAVIGTDLRVERADNAGQPTGVVEKAQLVNGDVVDENGKPIVLAKGEVIRGYFHVGFSEGKATHTNTLTVNATATSASGDVIGGVSDTDPFSSNYEKAPTYSLALRKVSGEGFNTTPEVTPLAMASIKLQATNLNELPTFAQEPDGYANQVVTRELGTYLTDSDGYFGLQLAPGVYRVSETTAPDGYVLPSGAWYIQLGYAVNGDPVVSVKAMGDQPYAQAYQVGDLNIQRDSQGRIDSSWSGAQYMDGADDVWGAVYLTNAPIISPPVTGGMIIWIALAGISLALIGVALFARRGATAE